MLSSSVTIAISALLLCSGQAQDVTETPAENVNVAPSQACGVELPSCLPEPVSEQILALGSSQLTPQVSRGLVTTRLMQLGLTADEATARVAALSDAELEQLATHPEQLAMGAVTNRTLIIITLIIVSGIALGLL